jgi:hypothetical protein
VVTTDGSTSRNIAWGPWMLAAVGGLMFLHGAGRLVLLHRFGFIDALYCCLAIVPAGLLLLVFDYVLHHAKLVAVIPLILAATLAYSSPIFEVAIGLALLGAVAGPALEEWKYEKRLRKSTAAHSGEEKEHTLPTE